MESPAPKTELSQMIRGLNFERYIQRREPVDMPSVCIEIFLACAICLYTIEGCPQARPRQFSDMDEITNETEQMAQLFGIIRCHNAVFSLCCSVAFDDTIVWNC